MSKKSQNSKLILLLFALLAVFIVAKFLKGDKQSTNMRTSLVEVDTSDVFSIYLKPAQLDQAMVFERSGSGWDLNYSEKQFKATNTSINNLLSEILNIEPNRLAGRSSDKWESFQVTDSAGSVLILKDLNGKELLNLIIGKFDYKPPKQTPGGMNQGNNIQGLSFVRLNNEDDTYAVDGFLSITINQKPEQFRNQNFMKLDLNNVRTLNFSYPGDSSFTVTKGNRSWNLREYIADSIKVVNYIKQFSNKMNNQFEDDYKPSVNPMFSLAISGDNMNDEFIRAWSNGDSYVYQTSQNEAYFKSSASAEFKNFFVPASNFIQSSTAN